MKINFKLKNISVFICGALLLGLGVNLINKALFGNNSLSLFVMGLHSHLPMLTYGMCNMMLCLFEILVGYILDKKNVTYMAFFAAFSASSSIDLTGLLVRELAINEVTLRIIYLLVGEVIYASGLGVEQAAHCGYNNFDCFIFGLGKLFKMNEYHKIRWIVDIVFLFLGMALGSMPGVGTIVVIAFTGLLVERFRYLTEKLIPLEPMNK